jgi:hypothetical protein
VIEYNSTFHVTSDCPIDDICDEINQLHDDVRAIWGENDDETIMVTVKGHTHTDELTLNYTPDTIQEQLDKLKEFLVPESDMFLAVILGSSDY